MTRNKESGQALIFGVLVLGLLLIGFAGLGVDVGYLRYEKRLQQGAADSAAIAGASNLPTAFGGVTAAAKNAASVSGFSVASANLGACPPTAPAAAIGSVSLTVNHPPCSGPHNGDSNYVEVYVAQVQPTYFMRALGITSETVTARAVATDVGGGTNTGCLYTLGSPTSSPEGVSVTGSAEIDAPSCGIVDNGNFNTTGKAFDVCTATLSVEGSSGSGTQGACGSKGLFCTAPGACPATGAPAAGDPLAYLSAPAQPANSSSCPKPTGTCTVSTNGPNNILQPGTYSNITFGRNSTTTLASGLYYINGTPGVSFGGSATVQGTGVTFYFTGAATIDATGGGNKLDMQVSAPTTGTYAGILFYQDRSDTASATLGGDNSTAFTGAMYFPSSQLTLSGNANLNASSAYSIIVTKALSLTGNPTVFLNADYSSLPGGVSVIKNAILVE